jgi:FkbM family methyltransferase
MPSLPESAKLAVAALIGFLRRSAVGPYGTAVLSRTRNGLLLVPPGDMFVGRRLCFNGQYDSELVDFVLARCNPEFRVLIVGAHVGSLVVPLARKVQTVTAVEANPSTFDLLRMNVSLNELKNVETHNFAAGDRNGEADFVATRLNTGGSGLQVGDTGAWDWAYAHDKPRTLAVPVRRLDDVFPADRFDIIVMDIEGAEPLALRGMRDLLRRSRGLLIEVFEQHLRHVAKISNDEFLALIEPDFDHAVILTEKPRRGEAAFSEPYSKCAFGEMMQECCARGMANVMFWKEQSQV